MEQCGCAGHYIHGELGQLVANIKIIIIYIFIMLNIFNLYIVYISVGNKSLHCVGFAHWPVKGFFVEPGNVEI